MELFFGAEYNNKCGKNDRNKKSSLGKWNSNNCCKQEPQYMEVIWGMESAWFENSHSKDLQSKEAADPTLTK